jgi:hypothetical protein
MMRVIVQKTKEIDVMWMLDDWSSGEMHPYVVDADGDGVPYGSVQMASA